MARHYLVIGASSGIGQAAAEEWLDKGEKVSVLARRAERLAPLTQRGATAFPVDVTDYAALELSVKNAVAANGLVDVMLFCAGKQIVKPARMATPSDLETMIATNVTAPLVAAGLFGSKKIAQPHAVMCIVSSIAATRPEAGITAYSATKAAVDNAVRGLAKELGPRRVVGVAPGWLDTEMTRAQSRLYNEAFREKLAKESPAGLASVAAVVDCIDFLVSDKARAISGEIIRVDGGIAA